MLRRELDGTGVHVTLVLPTWTRTDMVSTEMEEILEFEAESGFRRACSNFQKGKIIC